MKKKILIILSNDLFIRNYLTTDAFSLIEEKYDCFYSIDRSIKNKSIILEKNNFIGSFEYEEGILSKHYFFYNVLMYRYRKLSSSFQFRIKRGYYELLRNIKNLNSFKKYTSGTFMYLMYFYSKILMSFLGSAIIYPFYKKIYLKLLLINKDLLNHIKEIKPSLVIFPTSAYDPTGNDVIRICQNLNIKTLFLVDNWDNLSSKSIMWSKPDYISVWGEQSKMHAIKIQGIEEERIFIIGTPRFNNYFSLRDKYLESYFNYKYILFVGTALEFDEASVLKQIDDTIFANPKIFNGVKILYRPHPWRQGKQVISEKEFRNLIIDPQLSEAYLTGENGNELQPDINYYPSLLKNAEIIVGGLTTMIMEGLIFRKRVLAMAHDDGVNFTSPRNVFKNYTHFKGIENIEALNFCTNLKELEIDLIKTWSMRDSIDNEIVDSQRNYFLNWNNCPYNMRLVELIDKLI